MFGKQFGGMYNPRFNEVYVVRNNLLGCRVDLNASSTSFNFNYVGCTGYDMGYDRYRLAIALTRVSKLLLVTTWSLSTSGLRM